RGDLAAAARGLQQLAALRGHYDTTHRSIDHLWFETAAYLAAARGNVHDAAHLAHAAERTLGDGESSPFVTWTLHQQHERDPDWVSALAHPLNLDQATQLAVATTNLP